MEDFGLPTNEEGMERLKRFNWGAFLAAPLWNLVYGRWGWFVAVFLVNRVSKVANQYPDEPYYWILPLIYIGVSAASAITANKDGWRKRRDVFGTIDEFLKAQKKWVIWGIVLQVVILFLQYGIALTGG